jgi:parallel beta-helix repeat protein
LTEDDQLPEAWGFYILESSNPTIIENEILNIDNEGISILSSSFTYVIRNNIINISEISLRIFNSTDTMITENNITTGSDDGVSIYKASKTTIKENIIDNIEDRAFYISTSTIEIYNNTISNSGVGFYLNRCSNTAIYHNNIINNTVNAYDNRNNIWNNTYPSGGNYWSNYSVSAADNFDGAVTPQSTGSPDNICDIQYDIDENSTDFYPLKYPIGAALPPDLYPPAIWNLKPAKDSFINENSPLIGASYSDISGINVSAVTIEIDGVDVTSSSDTEVTATHFSHAIAAPLSEGVHDVYLEVSDMLGYTAYMNWSFTLDMNPPVISDQEPANQSLVNNSSPLIGASYSDDVGIDTSSIEMHVDGIPVYLLATETEAEYIPVSGLSEGYHTVNLTVGDLAGNTDSASWSFTIDSTSPEISDIQPINNSLINDNTPLITANFSDPSGIDPQSLVLEVDDVEVTSLGIVTASGISYTPSDPLSDGAHSVSLELKDLSGNAVSKIWYFEVDTNIPQDLTAPVVSDINPANGSITSQKNPMISAEYSDISGIDITSVILRVDEVDVTSNASVIGSGIRYTPTQPLENGTHTVYLEVSDSSGNHNTAVILWSFDVDEDYVPPDPKGDDGMGSAVLWIVVMIIILIALLLLFLLMKKRKKDEEQKLD